VAGHAAALAAGLSRERLARAFMASAEGTAHPAAGLSSGALDQGDVARALLLSREFAAKAQG
jgi:hypothetical protein